MNAQEVSDLVLAVESRLDHELFHAKGFNVWPLFRIELMHALIVKGISGQAKSGIREKVGTGISMVRRIFVPPSGSFGRPKSLGDADIWIISEGYSYQSIGDIDYQRFGEPLAKVCRQIGMVPALIDRGSPVKRKANMPAHWWAGTIVRAKIRGWISAQIDPDPAVLKLCVLLKEAMEAEGIDSQWVSSNQLNAKIKALESISEWIGGLFKLYQPRAILLVTYYDLSGQAICLAANRLGIPVIDIQHGVAGALHPAYGCWESAPPCGYELLPRVFWTWTMADANDISDWAERTNGAHCAVAGGNCYLEAWCQGDVPDSAEDSARVAQLRCTAKKGALLVLVTLQPRLVNEEALALLLQTMKLAGDCYWWLRLHPMGLDDRGQLERILAERRLENYDIEVSTSASLFALLAEADLHLTHSSSTVLEAESFGIRSIVRSSYGYKLYQASAHRGYVCLAEDASSLCSALDECRQARPRIGLPDSSGISSAAALRDVLKRFTVESPARFRNGSKISGDSHG
jgi:hypothetical protein